MKNDLMKDEPRQESSRWKIEKREVLHKNPWYEYRHDAGLTQQQKPFDYYYVYKGRSCGILALTGDRRLILVRQYRYLESQDLLQIPGGSVLSGTEPRDGAALELAEETGYVASEMSLLQTVSYAPGYAVDRASIFLASGCRQRGNQQLEATEEGMRVELLSIEEVYQAVDEGRITDIFTLAALCLARKRLLG